MKTLPSVIDTERQEDQSAWTKLFDVYLPEAVTTPWGAESVLRVTPLPDGNDGFDAAAGLSFFKPGEWPEPLATQEDATTYKQWPVQFRTVSSSARFSGQALTLTFSNISGEFATMLQGVDWYDVPVICRMIPTDTAAVAGDSITLFTARVDSAQVDTRQITLQLSNGLADLQTRLPFESMHARCASRFTDDLCTALKFSTANFKAGTCGSGSTTEFVKSTDISEDAVTAPYIGESVTATAASDILVLATHGLSQDDMVRLAASTIPTGLTAGRWYWVVGVATNTFQLALTKGGSAIDFTSDGAGVTIDSTSPLGTDEVKALSTGDITTSSEQTGNEGYRVQSSDSSHWKFSDTASDPSDADEFYSARLEIDFGSAQDIRRWEAVHGADDDPDVRTGRNIEFEHSSDGSTWESTRGFTKSASGSINASETKYFANYQVGSRRYWRLTISLVSGQPILTDVLKELRAYTAIGSGTDLVDALADIDFTASDEKTGEEGYRVQSSHSESWKMDAPGREEFGVIDWGINVEGYWTLPASQTGLRNAALEPYLEFDFTTAKALELWRFAAVEDAERHDIPRVLQIYSSSDATTWAHEMDFQLPAEEPGKLWPCRIHAATSARYWRVCVRNTWSQALNYTMLATVEAYTGGRDYWAPGWIVFDSATSTAALQDVKARVQASANGVARVSGLPAAPASGDTFTIRRDCPRSFNGCSERKNLENYRGFDDLAVETVVR